MPAKDIGLIEGLIDTFRRLFGSSSVGTAFVTLLAGMALYTLVANMVTWTIGANRSAAEAANNGDLPAIFAKMHPKFKTPTSSAIIGGMIGTVVLVIYGLLAKSAEDLFWSTFAFSSVVFLLPYFLLFGSFLKLRRTEPDLARPYKVPGGYPVALILSVICMAFIAQGIIFLIYKPGAFTLVYSFSILGGVLVTIVVGEVLVRASIKRAQNKKA